MVFYIIISLNRDGHQFLQYQQNEQSPLILAELTMQNRTRHMTLEIQILDFLSESESDKFF
jgi:hypothetical protein